MIIEEGKVKKEYKKKADLKTKTGKYFLARQSGKNKTDSKAIAGISPTFTPTRIEANKTYQALEEKHLKNHIEDRIKGEQVANALAENIEQDKDRGARNKAIEIYHNIVEPNGIQDDSKESVIIVFKEAKVKEIDKNVVYIDSENNRASQAN